MQIPAEPLIPRLACLSRRRRIVDDECCPDFTDGLPRDSSTEAIRRRFEYLVDTLGTRWTAATK